MEFIGKEQPHFYFLTNLRNHFLKLKRAEADIQLSSSSKNAMTFLISLQHKSIFQKTVEMSALNRFFRHKKILSTNFHPYCYRRNAFRDDFWRESNPNYWFRTRKNLKILNSHLTYRPSRFRSHEHRLQVCTGRNF